jgi:glutathione S-transferase
MLEGVQIYFSHLRDYEITKGRPNLEKFIDEMNKIEAYTQTKNSPQYLLDVVAKEHLKVTLDSNSHFFFSSSL